MLIAVLPGDGIGPEVTGAAVEVCRAAAESASIEWAEAPFGFTARLQDGNGFPERTKELCASADAVLLGAVGGPESAAPEVDVSGVEGRPDFNLLDLRGALGTWANIRPVRPHPALREASPLRPERLAGVDILFVRELTGGIYFGEKTSGPDRATDLCVYTRAEIERVVRRACEYAQVRRRKVTSVDKANVLSTSRLWRRVTQEVVDREFPDIELEHLLVDAMAMHMLSRPSDFDVIVTENMFGDILTDEASMLAGSLGLLPSASLGNGKGGIYEPIHGSAPDIAGQGVANPYGAILSGAMLMRWSLDLPAVADRIEAAVDRAIRDGVATPDIGGDAKTATVTAAVIAQLAG